MSKEIVSSSVIKPIGEPDQYFMNHNTFKKFCEEFLKSCAFVQHIQLLCSFPNLIPVLTTKTKHEINLDDLDFTRCDLHHSEDIHLLNKLNSIFPNIKKIKIYTRRFNSNVNDVLRSFSSFVNLEDFDILFDSVDVKNHLNIGFRNLRRLSITVNKRKISNLRKSKYLVHNVLQFTSKLVNVEFSNVLVDTQVSMALNYNRYLESLELINCKLEIGGRLLFKSFLNIRCPKKLLVHELEVEDYYKLIETIFKQIPISNKLKELEEIAFNVFDIEHIPYQNIRYCTKLKGITLIYFDYITPSFKKIFKELVNILRAMKNPFSLCITRIKSESTINNDDTYDDIHYDFEQYLEDLDIYFGSISFITYPRIRYY